jgi:hypothetical protein
MKSENQYIVISCVEAVVKKLSRFSNFSRTMLTNGNISEKN